MSGDAACVRVARHRVSDTLSDFPPGLREAAVLLAGELVTNAVLHGGGWFMLELVATARQVRVEVTDSSPNQPRVLTMTGDREHGRGLAIVEAIATKWGTDHLGTHKVVWFEVDAGP